MAASISTDDIASPLHDSLIGRSASIREVGELITAVAASDIAVLITGESGTGKDICARLLHKLSPRSNRPFVKVNCPAIPESILESELFGYERGAFTGARGSKPGRCELAHRGTLMLDEIAETSHAVQGKLLQVLDGEPVMRIGGVNPIHVDVRIVGATNLIPEEAIERGRLREDLFFRLSDVVIHMPALRDRREDIPLLAEHFNYHLCSKLALPYRPLPTRLSKQFQEMDWPGNIRELAAHVKKYLVTDGDAAAEEPEPSIVTPAPNGRQASTVIDDKDDSPKRFESLKEATRRVVEETERTLIKDALRYTLWNRRKAAKLLDISYSSLLRRIDAYRIGNREAE